jgi:signal transduction histidine kinase
MRYSATKILKPIKEINEATKRISTGNFDVELQCNREDEIGELSKNFNAMAKDLNKIEVIQKDFINNMSHEMKTPISSIKGFAQLLKEEDLTEEEKKEYIDIIVEESDRLLNISSNILKLSKLQNKEKLQNKKYINIAEQIKKAITLLENKWMQKNIKITTNLPDTIILGDEELLYQVWTNLIDNAIKFTKNKGNIHIGIKRKDDKALISIKDDGIGLTETEKRKIFDRFYQVDESHYSEGSGLGLSIVTKIISLSEGKISVESQKGKGSNFIVELPYEKTKQKI